MRDLIFKNLTSSDRRKRVISCSEVLERQGMLTTIRRHFVCKIIEIKGDVRQKPVSQIYVRRNCNHTQKQKSLFCRIKGSLFAESNGRLFLILFGHSFKVDLRPKFELRP